MSTRSAGTVPAVAGWLSMVAVGLLCGCPEFDYEGGRWACDSNADCPEGHACDVERHACAPRDGSGGGGCSEGCDHVVACSDDVTHQLCVLGCSAAGPACEECLGTTNCIALGDCESVCSGGGGGGGGNGGGGERCALVCSHLVSCGGAAFSDCQACCDGGGFGCDEWLDNSDCGNIAQCGSACLGLGG